MKGCIFNYQILKQNKKENNIFHGSSQGITFLIIMLKRFQNVLLVALSIMQMFCYKSRLLIIIVMSGTILLRLSMHLVIVPEMSTSWYQCLFPLDFSLLCLSKRHGRRRCLRPRGSCE